MTTSSRPSASVEDYLKALYSLEPQDEERVRIKDIAELLDVSLPSVTTMMKALAEQDLVERTAYRGVVLTKSGRREALKVIRKHRLIEVFLVEVLGYTWDEVHEEAERLEHAMSDLLTNRIDRHLGYPSADPHGDPIPNADGVVEKQRTHTLVELPVDHHAVVRRVTDQSSEALQYLAERGIQPDVRLKVIRLDPFDGPVWLEVDGEVVVLSRTLAHRVHVDETPSA